MYICDKMQLKIRITVKISNEYNISYALILSTHYLRCIFFTIPGFSLLFAMQHCADSLLFPSIAFLHSTLNLLADRAKGYTVSRRIPFEPPLIKLKSRKRSLLINLFNRGNRGYRSSKRLFPSFASITTICKTQRSGRKKKDQMENKKKRGGNRVQKEKKKKKDRKGGGGRGREKMKIRLLRSAFNEIRISKRSG